VSKNHYRQIAPILLETVGDALAEILRRFAHRSEPGLYLIVLEATAEGPGGVGGAIAELPGLCLELGVIKYLAYGLAKGAEHLTEALGSALFICLFPGYHFALLG